MYSLWKHSNQQCGKKAIANKHDFSRVAFYTLMLYEATSFMDVVTGK
jgi:hypothetical protein